MAFKNIRQSSSGQYYLTFADINTGEVVMARFLPWSQKLLMFCGQHQETINVKGKAVLISVPDFQFVDMADYALMLGDDLIHCGELWQ